MTDLYSLDERKKEMLSSLPYRAGLWMSMADNTGESSEEEEIRVLNNIVDGFARDVFGSELVQNIMTETFKSKDRWPVWAKETGNVLQDCSDCVALVRQLGDDKDVTAFRDRIMEIAEAVAMAFSEYEDLDFFEKLKLNMQYMSETSKAKKNGDAVLPKHQFFSVSLKERKALRALSRALGKT